MRTPTQNEEALNLVRQLLIRMRGFAFGFRFSGYPRVESSSASPTIIRLWIEELQKIETELNKENQ